MNIQIYLIKPKHALLRPKDKTTMKQEIGLGTTEKNQGILCEIRVCLRDDNQY